ncbi:unnamed protein product, partial [Laminaria digitata]
KSLEEPVVRSNVLRLAYLPLWGALQPGRLALELRPYPQLKRHWQHLKVTCADLARRQENEPGMERYESEFLPSLVRMFLSSVEAFSQDSGNKEAGKEGGRGKEPPRGLLDFCERFMEFLIDLLCQLPTRYILVRAV